MKYLVPGTNQYRRRELVSDKTNGAFQFIFTARDTTASFGFTLVAVRTVASSTLSFVLPGNEVAVRIFQAQKYGKSVGKV